MPDAREKIMDMNAELDTQTFWDRFQENLTPPDGSVSAVSEMVKEMRKELEILVKQVGDDVRSAVSSNIPPHTGVPEADLLVEQAVNDIEAYARQKTERLVCAITALTVTAPRP